ncbi:MAG: cytochrome b/b6 domain-containing protein [Amaricoccus sp.]|uniref:cytochrome b/b6 domain-containing protein n=1 Tax=Amaricoccus sp. TaxID=1872485 RepID=UPI0039E57B52
MAADETDAFWGSSVLDAVHEALAQLILALVAGHLAGVVFESWRHRENLIGAMITGRKHRTGA